MLPHRTLSQVVQPLSHYSELNKIWFSAKFTNEFTLRIKIFLYIYKILMRNFSFGMIHKVELYEKNNNNF